MKLVVGLGNPGEEYENTRHNTGRSLLAVFGKSVGAEWKEDKKLNAFVAKVKIRKIPVTLILPNTFMNKSGAAVSKFVSAKGGSASGGKNPAERMVVVYDDLDLPLGTMKISYDRGSGGHKGVESIMRAVKTKKFTRVRVGVSPATSGGKLRKPQGEKEVVSFILSKFKPAELVELKKVFKKVAGALEATVADGPQIAMNRFN